MEKNLVLSPQELKLFLNSLSKDEDFRTDLEMILKKDYKKFDDWLKTMHPMHFILEDLMIATWPTEFIQRYVEVINIDERLRRQLLQSAGKDIVLAIIRDTSPSVDESNIVLNRPDGTEYIGILLENGADLDENAEETILTRGTEQDKQKYCLECETLYNIKLLLKDEQSRRLLLLYINNNGGCYGFEDNEVLQLLPYPELMKAYTTQYNVSYELVKDNPNFDSYISNITIYECDWVDISKDEKLFEKFVKSALKTDSQKQSLRLAIDLYPEQMTIPTAKMLQKLNTFDDKLVLSLLKTTNEEILGIIPKDKIAQQLRFHSIIDWFAQAHKTNGIKFFLQTFEDFFESEVTTILDMKDAEIAQMLIEKQSIPSFSEYRLIENYSEQEAKKLILYYGKHYTLHFPDVKKAYNKYRREEFWQKVKKFFRFG